ncbi:MAG: cold shock domain-containing protein [Methylococcales symbiont of Iophon sp. n. MRB-2018]|nr:MAG: cold shock domain-containing protein [Methylococcales symbiont of Iophon sp. n. MRB-2018]KAF3978869.1 MAG: cold shock domain-containing protein [Methylococcales symbiont of Iophon sp. n. MRB-2018]
MAEENKGFLKTWKDDRGFGFIKPDDDSDDIFIHISALGEGARRPHRGDTIFYQIEEADGKTKAVNAYIVGEKNLSKKSTIWIWITLFSMSVAGVVAAVILLDA